MLACSKRKKTMKQSILELSYHLVSSSKRVLLVLNKCVFWPMGNIITHRHSISSLFTHKTICERAKTNTPNHQTIFTHVAAISRITQKKIWDFACGLSVCCLCVRQNLTNTNTIHPRRECLYV